MLMDHLEQSHDTEEYVLICIYPSLQDTPVADVESLT